jgi:hypothetical protein
MSPLYNTLHFTDPYETMFSTHRTYGERHNSVGMANGYGVYVPGIGFRFPARTRDFTAQRSDRLWGPLSLLSNRYRE